MDKEYVMRGNSAILKCSIPSFVADFVHVVGWIDEENNEFLPSAEGNFSGGKKSSEICLKFPRFPYPILTIYHLFLTDKS